MCSDNNLAESHDILSGYKWLNKQYDIPSWESRLILSLWTEATLLVHVSVAQFISTFKNALILFEF